MELRALAREAGAFQRGLAVGEIEAICRRAFGSGVVAVRAVELGLGGYNSVYRVEFGWMGCAGGSAGGAGGGGAVRV
jgi:hypothetical protein